MELKVKTCIYGRRKASEDKTVVFVSPLHLYPNSDPNWDKYFVECKDLVKQGFSAVINSESIAPDFVSAHLESGVYVLRGQIDALNYIRNNTPYEWRYIRHKLPQEAIGGGRLPRSIGEFVLKDK